jgi:hypothetical protein
MRGTTSTRMQVAVDETLPEPITCTLTVVELLHPAETVLLPLRLGPQRLLLLRGWFLFLGTIESL